MTRSDDLSHHAKERLVVNRSAPDDDSSCMFPLCELFTHAEAAKPRAVSAPVREARSSPRLTRYGNVILYPQVERQEPIDKLEEDPTVIAAISNVSGNGLGLVHSDPLPNGTIFEIDWEAGSDSVTLRFEAVHSQRVTPGMYRTGARLLEGTIPSNDRAQRMLPSNASEQSPAKAAALEPETLAGTTPCGFDREIEINLADGHLHLHIHSPGQQNGWGINLRADQFEAALARLRAARQAASPKARAA
jgi:hypothetical protein